MNNLLTQFAVTEAATNAEGGDLFISIGIDLKLLILQAIAFLILLWFLKKFVYPPLIAMLDKHDAKMAEAATAAREAQKMAANSQAETEKLLRQARKEAAGIVGNAKDEANDMLRRSESKSKAHAEAIVAAAKADIEKEILVAKKTLHNETIELVAAATAKVASAQISAQTDESLIRNALEEAK